MNAGVKATGTQFRIRKLEKRTLPHRSEPPVSSITEWKIWPSMSQSRKSIEGRQFGHIGHPGITSTVASVAILNGRFHKS